MSLVSRTISDSGMKPTTLRTYEAIKLSVSGSVLFLGLLLSIHPGDQTVNTLSAINTVLKY